MTRVAALVPAFQAARSVGALVKEARQFVDEVLVVDDGSDDGTGAAALAAGARVLRHETNLGKGRALQTGFHDLLARGFDRVATLDADGQHLPGQLPLILEAAEGADLVLGSRTRSFAQMSRLRRVSNRLSSRVIAAFAGCSAEDVQTGFRVYSRALIERVGMPEPRFEAESAIVVRASRAGLRIVSVPVELGFADGRVTSHYRPLVDSLRIAWAVVRARREHPS